MFGGLPTSTDAALWRGSYGLFPLPSSTLDGSILNTWSWKTAFILLLQRSTVFRQYNVNHIAKLKGPCCYLHSTFLFSYSKYSHMRFHPPLSHISRISFSKWSGSWYARKWNFKSRNLKKIRLVKTPWLLKWTKHILAPSPPPQKIKRLLFDWQHLDISPVLLLTFFCWCSKQRWLTSILWPTSTNAQVGWKAPVPQAYR